MCSEQVIAKGNSVIFVSEVMRDVKRVAATEAIAFVSKNAAMIIATIRIDK